MKNSYLNFVSAVVVVFSCLLLVTSCSQIEEQKSAGLIDSLESLVQRIEQDGANYTEEEWNNAAQEYEGLVEQIDAREYSDEDLKRIGKLKARYLTASYDYELNNGIKKINRLLKEVEGALE